VLRTSCSLLVCLALAGLLAPAAAQAPAAQAPSVQAPAVPVPPVPGVPAPTNRTGMAVDQINYGEPVESDTITSVSEIPSPTVGSVPGMAFGSNAGMGQFRSRFWQPFVGVEAVFLAPIHNTGGGGANYTFNDPTATTSFTASNGNGMVVTPRLWLGMIGQRWGIGFRYWGFSNDPGGGQFPDNPTSQGVFTQGVLKLQTFDFDVIRRFQFDDHQLWLTVGLRQAGFARNSTASSSDILNNGFYSASASSSSRFNGFGITTSLYGLSPLGSSDWSLFYGGRVSYLSACTSSAFAEASASYVDNHAATSIYPAGSWANGDAFIGELQLGAQYNHALEPFPATAFFRIGGEFQYWHVNNGCSASAFANAGPLSGSALVTATAAAGNSNLALLGFGISTGLTW
jgi:hypothetical protein